jgi:hypothetical protein
MSLIHSLNEYLREFTSFDCFNNENESASQLFNNFQKFSSNEGAGEKNTTVMGLLWL